MEQVLVEVAGHEAVQVMSGVSEAIIDPGAVPPADDEPRSTQDRQVS